MIELAIVAVAVVCALAAWDVARRRVDTRKVDDRADIERAIEAAAAHAGTEAKALADRIANLEARVTQIGNARPGGRRPLNRLG